MTMVSYAQNHEDVLLNRLFSPGRRGFYIDVGANDPLHETVTRHFYEQGWRGINIEPGRIFERIAMHRPGDTNLNVALSDRVGMATFHEFVDYPGSSTCSRAEADVHRREHGFACEERMVSVTTLAAVCEEHAPGPIDFVSIDVEGHEREVLAGGDWRRWRPLAVVVEATRPNTTIATHQQWEAILLEADYVFATFDGINRYYVRGEDRALADRLAAPVNVLDDYVAFAVLRAERLLAERQRQLLELETTAARLRERLEDLERLGPTCLAVARRLHGLTERFPRVAAGLKRLSRRAA